MHAIPVLNQVCGAGSLAPFMGDYGTVWGIVNAPHTHYRGHILAKSECKKRVTQTHRIRSEGDVA